MSIPESVEEILARYWRDSGAEAERKAQEPYVLPDRTPSLLGACGTRVRVIGLDPDWLYACAGHPAVGSEGEIAEDKSPEGRTCVEFRGVNGTLEVTRGGPYTGLDSRPLLLYMLDATLEVLP